MSPTPLVSEYLGKHRRATLAELYAYSKNVTYQAPPEVTKKRAILSGKTHKDGSRKYTIVDDNRNIPLRKLLEKSPIVKRRAKKPSDDLPWRDVLDTWSILCADKYMEEFKQRPNNSRYKVYVIVCKDTQKMYVGITGDINRRILEHQNPGGVIHDNGIERFYYGVIAWANHREGALQLETFFMDKLCAISSGFNKQRSILDK